MGRARFCVSAPIFSADARARREQRRLSPPRPSGVLWLLFIDDLHIRFPDCATAENIAKDCWLKVTHRARAPSSLRNSH